MLLDVVLDKCTIIWRMSGMRVIVLGFMTVVITVFMTFASLTVCSNTLSISYDCIADERCRR